MIKLRNEDIFQVICDEFELDYDTVMSLNHVRNREFIDARAMFYYVKRVNTGDSLQKIANFFNKNHATVIHGSKRAGDLIEYDTTYKKVFKRVERRLEDLESLNGVIPKRVQITMKQSVYNDLSKEVKLKFERVKEIV